MSGLDLQDPAKQECTKSFSQPVIFKRFGQEGPPAECMQAEYG